MDSWELAHGVRKSGLDRLLEEGNAIARAGFDQVASAVMGHAADTRDSFDFLCRAFAQQSIVLSSIENLIRNPKATEADEYFRRGIRALRAGWFSEATTELRRSVEINPYVPIAQFSLGLALGANNEPDLAAKAFAYAVRYASDSASTDGLMCGAALLGARAHMSRGQETKARELARQARNRVQDCAELELLWARLNSDPQATVNALHLAPELTGIAVNERMPGAIQAANSLCESGPVLSLNRAESLRSQLTGRPALRTVGNNPEGISQGYRTWADEEVPRIRAEIHDFRRQLEQARASLTSARWQADRTPDPTGPSPATLWLLLVVGGAVAIVAGSIAVAQNPNAAIAVLTIPFVLIGLGSLIVRYSENGAVRRIEASRDIRERGERARAKLPELEAHEKRLSAMEALADALEETVSRALPKRTFPLTKIG